MQGSNHPGVVSTKGESAFFYERRWCIPVGMVVVTNLFYLFGVKWILRRGSVEDLGIVDSLHDTSILLFSILPFSKSYHARLELAYSDSASVILVVYSHAFILFTSGLLLLIMLSRIRDLLRYVANAKERGRREPEWSYYFNAIRMSFVVLPCLAGFVLSTTLPSVSKPDLILDGALLSAVFTPLLVYYGMCAVLLVHLSRNRNAGP